MKSFLNFLFAVSSSSILLIAGCNSPSFTAKRDFETTIDASGPTLVHATTFNGAIDVTQSPDKEIHLVAHLVARGYTQAEADKALDSLIPQVNVSDSKVSIASEKSASSMFVSHSVAYELQIPKGWPLKLETSNGKVTCTDSESPVTAWSSNGAIHITNAAESVEISTSNGGVTLERCTGTIQAESSNGAMKIINCQIEKDSKLQTSNGAISVSLRDDHPIKIDASTSNGSIKTDVDFDEETKSSRKLVGVAFAGKSDSKDACKLTLSTSNGAIKIEQAAKE